MSDPLNHLRVGEYRVGLLEDLHRRSIIGKVDDHHPDRVEPARAGAGASTDLRDLLDHADRISWLAVMIDVRQRLCEVELVHVRAAKGLTGDVIAARISIEDGAFFKGGIDIRKPGGTDLKGGSATPAAAEPVAVEA